MPRPACGSRWAKAACSTKRRRCALFSWISSARSAATPAPPTPPRKPAPRSGQRLARRIGRGDAQPRLGRSRRVQGAAGASERAMLNNAAWRSRPPAAIWKRSTWRPTPGMPRCSTTSRRWARRPRPCSARRWSPWNGSARWPRSRWSVTSTPIPTLLADRPLLRADYMGNVDLSDPAQLAAGRDLPRAHGRDRRGEGQVHRPAGDPGGVRVRQPAHAPDDSAMSLPDHRALVNQVAGQLAGLGQVPGAADGAANAVRHTGTRRTRAAAGRP